ncbi:hypothetical protein SCHPADRAFT_449622 [Schizopora paradoxa]|uniref:DUF6534 domain-containing protein n=1 Tax=Schizopora paradoxa TaxID=27342 RepID=A0A0H2RQX0_9AGAM|nr:hypothetical protein SCHPADRAFT_449622 [Schizopora paradoxa]
MSSDNSLPALDNTFGAMFLGVIIAMGLWGASTVQVYYYYDQYSKDTWHLKSFVALVWVLDTTHQALIVHSTYRYLITNYFNPAHLGVLEPTLLAMILFNAIICALVQGFFLFRVWRLSQHNHMLVGTLALFSAGQAVSILVYFIKSIHFTEFAQLTTLFTLEKVLNVFGVVSDFTIAGTLIILLHRSRTGFRRSETIVNRLILFTINTGLATSLCAILALIFVSVFPNTFIYIFFYLLISKMYSNSLMATLNARKSVGGRAASSAEHSGMESIHLSRVRHDDGINISTFSKGNEGRMLAIKVDTQTRHDTDDMMMDKANSLSSSTVV